MREACILSAVLVPVFGLAGVVWWQVFGAQSLPAFLLPAGICLLFGVLALLVQEQAIRRESDLAGSLGAILLRTLGPMLFAVVLPHWNPGLVEQRIFPAFVGCYLLTLAVETVLSVWLVNRLGKAETQSQITGKNI